MSPLKITPILALAISLAGVQLASADDKPEASGQDRRLEKAFGSTIVSTYPDGRQAELWLQRDGSYTAEGRRHDRSSGTWQIKTDKAATKLCLKQRRPFAAPFSFCTPVPEGGLDRPWTGKAYTGEQTSIRLMKGVYDPAKGDDRKAETTRSNDEG
jgi:hypothetical protein